MKHSMSVALRMAAVTLVLTGIVYPLVVTGLASLAFPRQAGGSLVERDGRVVGSSLIGQRFNSARYFHPRPSMAGAGYDPTKSGPSNLGPTSRALISQVESRVADALAEEPGARGGLIPVDLVTASGSGLDPDISPDSAYLQAPRVAEARGLALRAVRTLVAQHTRQRQLGLFGEARVNVLELNLALDAVSSK